MDTSRPWPTGSRRPGDDGPLAVFDPVLLLDGEADAATGDPLISEEERRAETFKRRLLRLALDVHDGPMQNLGAIGHNLYDLRRRIQELVPPDSQPEIDATVKDITKELAQVEQELRALINALEDGAVKTIPLVDAIEVEIAEFKRHSLANIELVVEGNPQARTDSQRIALQRITRAALANVSRHADAYHVSVRLLGGPSSIRLEIEDNGRGFNADKPAKPGRLGLAGMKERAELLGGEFRVASRPGGPTVISVELQSWGPPPDLA